MRKLSGVERVMGAMSSFESLLYINREDPLWEAFVTAEEPITSESLPTAVTPGGLSQGHCLLPFPAGEGDAWRQVGV